MVQWLLRQTRKCVPSMAYFSPFVPHSQSLESSICSSSGCMHLDASVSGSHFQYLRFFEAFSHYPTLRSQSILSSTWASSFSESACFGVLAFHFHPNQEHTWYAQTDVPSHTHHFVFSGTNPRFLLFLLGQGSPSPISIYSALSHVNTSTTYLFVYLFILRMILLIEKEKHILRCPETGVTVYWSWMSGPSLTHRIRP